MSEGRAPGPPEAVGGVVIRPAELADLDRVWELMRGLAAYERLEDRFTGSPERLAGHLFGGAWPQVECLVAADAGQRLVGYALYYGVFSSFWTAPMLWLEDLFVPDAERGRGVGRALMAAVARVAVARGCPRVDWVVLDWNESAMAFYRGLGAEWSSDWHNYRVSGARLEALAAEAGAWRHPAPGTALLPQQQAQDQAQDQAHHQRGAERHVDPPVLPAEGEVPRQPTQARQPRKQAQ